MFGNLFRRDHEPAPAQQAAPPAAARAPSGSGFATFDRLGQTLVATLTTHTLAAADAMDLSSHLGTSIESGDARHLVLDLQNVQYMDSMCVGVLVELLTKLQSRGGRIALVNACGNVEYLFKLTRLDRLFPICRDVMKAIEVVERGG